jgi:hypothetical protein
MLEKAETAEPSDVVTPIVCQIIRTTMCQINN